MKKILPIIIACLLGVFVFVLMAQNQAGIQSQTFVVPSPSGVTFVALSLVPPGTTGRTTYYYHVVTVYPVGSVAPVKPAVISNGPATINAGHGIAVSWHPVPNVLAYDVVRTTTPRFPANGCTGCYVARTTNLTVTDIGGAGPAYTFSPAKTATATFTLNNRDYANPTLESETSLNIKFYPVGLLPWATTNSGRMVRFDNSADSTTCDNTKQGKATTVCFSDGTTWHSMLAN